MDWIPFDFCFVLGLGETSMLAYTPKFNRNVIPAWSSGTGAAGVAGALTYSALYLLRFSPESTLLLMLVVPLLQLVTFCFIVKEPYRAWTTVSGTSSTTSLIDHANYERGVTFSQPPLSFTQKLHYFPHLLKYILPLFVVYSSEYFINQGLVRQHFCTFTCFVSTLIAPFNYAFIFTKCFSLI